SRVAGPVIEPYGSTPSCNLRVPSWRSFLKIVSTFDVRGLRRRQQHSFFQMPRHVRVRGRMGIVRDHYDGLLEILIQALQNLEHFRRLVAVQVARWLIGEQQSR